MVTVWLRRNIRLSLTSALVTVWLHRTNAIALADGFLHVIAGFRQTCWKRDPRTPRRYLHSPCPVSGLFSPYPSFSQRFPPRARTRVAPLPRPTSSNSAISTQQFIRDGTFAFGANPFLVPDTAVIRAARFYNPGDEVVSASLNTLVLERGNVRLLVDAGVGLGAGFANLGKTKRLMIEAGIMPSSITGVLITHAHGDHVGGLVNADGSAAFPNARVYVHRKEFNFWTRNPSELAKLAPELQLPFISK